MTRPSAADTIKFLSLGIGRIGSRKNCKINKDIIHRGIDAVGHQRVVAKLATTESPRNNQPSFAIIG